MKNPTPETLARRSEHLRNTARYQPIAAQARLLALCRTLQRPDDRKLNDLEDLISGLERADATDERGTTALMFAARHLDRRYVEALLPKSSPQVRTRDGITALMYAAQGHRPENLDALLDVSDLQARDNNGWTVLTYAALWDRPAQLERLLPRAVGEDLVETFELTLVNRRAPMALRLVQALPSGHLGAALNILDTHRPSADPHLIQSARTALHAREKALLAEAIDKVRPTEPTRGRARL